MNEYLEAVRELNNSLDSRYLENFGVCFSWQTNDFTDLVLFGDFVVFSSEDNDGWDFVTNKQTSVLDQCKKNFNNYVAALNTVKL